MFRANFVKYTAVALDIIQLPLVAPSLATTNIGFVSLSCLVTSVYNLRHLFPLERFQMRMN